MSDPNLVWLAQKGIRLIHCKTDVEQITNGTTIEAIRARKQVAS